MYAYIIKFFWNEYFRKGFDKKMSKDKIPQYHPSYTEEENKVVHDYLEHATAESLAQSIQDFCESYPGEVRESILENLNQLRKELSQRLNMKKDIRNLYAVRICGYSIGMH